MDEKRRHKPFWYSRLKKNKPNRTKKEQGICEDYETIGFCYYGKQCVYKHGEEKESQLHSFYKYEMQIDRMKYL